MDSLVANIFLKQIILIYKLQTLIILSLFKISTLLVFLMSQNQSQSIIAWQLIRMSNWIRPLRWKQVNHAIKKVINNWYEYEGSIYAWPAMFRIK